MCFPCRPGEGFVVVVVVVVVVVLFCFLVALNYKTFIVFLIGTSTVIIINYS